LCRDESAQAQTPGLDLREAAERQLARPRQRARQRTLGAHRQCRVAMLERCEPRDEISAFGETLDAERALAWRWQAVGGIDERGDALGESESFQPGRGDDDRIVLAVVELAQARADVAAQRFDLELRKAVAQLAFAPQARRADARAGRQCRERGKSVR